MVIGIGNDIIEVARIQSNIETHGDRFLNRVFTQAEQEYCLKHRDSAVHFAGRFAAKEAVAKALGTGFSQGVSWLDIEILNDGHGKPYVNGSPHLNELFDHPNLLIAISHCKEYATAFSAWIRR